MYAHMLNIGLTVLHPSKVVKKWLVLLKNSGVLSIIWKTYIESILLHYNEK